MARAALTRDRPRAVSFHTPSICPAMPQKTSRRSSNTPVDPLKTRNTLRRPTSYRLRTRSNSQGVDVSCALISRWVHFEKTGIHMLYLATRQEGVEKATRTPKRKQDRPARGGLFGPEAMEPGISTGSDAATNSDGPSYSKTCFMTEWEKHRHQTIGFHPMRLATSIPSPASRSA